MTFTVEELEALVLGARLVEAWADPALGASVRAAMLKVEAVLPEPLQAAMLKTVPFRAAVPSAGRRVRCSHSAA
jgi:predicted DNA-binding transcriptional regulator YafY